MKNNNINKYLVIFKTGSRRIHFLNEADFASYANVYANDIAYIFKGDVCVYEAEEF